MKRLLSFVIIMLLTISVCTPSVFAEGETAAYQIVTYCMDVYGDSYEVVSTEEATGVIDDYVSVTPEEMEGFSFNTYYSQTGGYVDRYGDLTLYLYYDRLEWCFTIYAGNEVYDEFITYYGAPIEDIPDIFMEDFIFEGWEEDIPETMPNEDFELHAKLSPLGKTYISVSGLASVTYGTRTINSEDLILSKLGTRTTLTANESAESEFLYWVNDETNRVVSFDPVYSFNVCPYIYLRAEFYETDEDYHYVTFLNPAGTVIDCEEYEIGDDDIDFPTPPNLPGHVFDGTWTMTAQEISETPGNVVVYPNYTKSNNTYTVTITNDFGTSGAGTYESEEIVTISAPKEGFSYWIDDNNEIVSYYPVYRFNIVYDAVFTAVYYDVEREKVACRIVKMDQDTATHKLTVFEEWSVGSSFEVHATGIIATANANIGSDPDNFIIGTSGVSKGTSAYYTLNGLYSLDLLRWTSGRTFYARPYVIVGDSSGHQHTVYGTIRSCTAP